MTFDDLLNSTPNGLPMVKVDHDIRGATSRIGKVVVIKDNGRHRGCAVQFPGLNYDTWFSDSEETDARSKYMRQLTLLKWRPE
jgi:hypothetical protein